jgi:hypothetical protein
MVTTATHAAATVGQAVTVAATAFWEAATARTVGEAATAITVGAAALGKATATAAQHTADFTSQK